MIAKIELALQKPKWMYFNVYKKHFQRSVSEALKLPNQAYEKEAYFI